METLAYSSLILRSSRGEKSLDSIDFKQHSEVASLAVTLALGLMPNSAQASLVQNDRCNAVADLQSALQYEGFDPVALMGILGSIPFWQFKIFSTIEVYMQMGLSV